MNKNFYSTNYTNIEKRNGGDAFVSKLYCPNTLHWAVDMMVQGKITILSWPVAPLEKSLYYKMENIVSWNGSMLLFPVANSIFI